MKCCFFNEPAGFPTLGSEYLVAVLRGNGHHVDVVFDRKEFRAWEAFYPTSDLDDKVVNDIIGTGCQVLFAYSTTVNFKRLLNLFDLVKAKAPEIIIAVGGPHPTYAHEHTIRKKDIDFLCRGEGEIAILEIIDLIEGRRSDLPPGVYRMNGTVIEGSGFGSLVGKMDDLPYPDKSDYYEKVPNGRSVYTAASGRGCYNSCTFCNSPTMRTHYSDEGFQFMRRRTVEDIVAEIALAKEAYNPRMVWFCDDVFIYNWRYMAEFAKQYKEHVGIPFGCSTIPNFFNEEVIDALVDAGLSNVEVGVQSLNPETRLSVFGRKESNEQFTAFVQMLRKRGVYVNTDHIINPWDSRENLKQQVLQYSEARPSFINVFHLQYFPDTKVIQEAVRDGHLAPEAVEEIGEGSIDSYFLGGSIPELMRSLHDLVVFMSFVPFLPTWLTKLIVTTPLLVLFKFMPSQVILPLRALSALFHKADAAGRSQVKIFFLSLLKINLAVTKDQVNAIREMGSRKPHKSLVSAMPRQSTG
jgi:radical SAM superfamily enzyme YgiQ (UPF0313 family)